MAGLLSRPRMPGRRPDESVFAPRDDGMGPKGPSGRGFGAGGADADPMMERRPGPGGEEMPVHGREGESNVTPEEQAEYDRFVDNAFSVIYDKKTFPAVLRHLGGNGDPVEGLANAAVMVVMRLDDSARQKGHEIPGDVMMHGGVEIIEDLAATAGKAGIHDYTAEELEAATLRAMDLGREMMTKSGRLDPKVLEQQFGQIVAADREGRLGEMMPGLEAAAKRPAPANSNEEA